MDVEDFILLGGKISAKHPIYMDLAQLASYGFLWMLLKKFQAPDWKKQTGLQKINDILYLAGQAEFMEKSTEITKLSAIMGNTKQRYSSKRLPDVLRILRNRPTKDSNTSTTS